MEEKKKTGNYLSTFLLIISIIVICIMGYFLYNSNANNSEFTESKEVSTTSNDSLEDNSAKQNITFSSLCGGYIGNADVEPGTTLDDETEVFLYLFEDGGFRYYNEPGLDSGLAGYYTFNDNELVLHEVVACANDIGRTIINDTMTLKINDDNSITDTKLNAKLEKSSQKIDEQAGIISTEIKNALNNKSLQY